MNKTSLRSSASQKAPPGKFAGRMKKLGAAMWRNRAIYVILLPGLVWYIIFAYIPMGGLSLAFKSYKANLGIWASPWIGLQNFENVFRDANFWKSIVSTLVINAGRLILCFPAPIIVALLLNELRLGRYKKVLQTIYTFPHFLSWIIVASIFNNLLAYDGLVNSFIKVLGGEGVNFLGSTQLFRPLLFMTEIWKASGYSAIIYLAAISGIDVSQYEAAEMDGANRWQRLVHITIPNIMPTITVLLILQVGNIMTAGFDQIFNMSNAAVKSVAEVLDVYIYRVTFQSAADFGFSTAISLFRSLINLILLSVANWGSKALGGSGLIG